MTLGKQPEIISRTVSLRLRGQPRGTWRTTATFGLVTVPFGGLVSAGDCPMNA